MSALVHARAPSNAERERRRIWTIEPARLMSIDETRAGGRMFAVGYVLGREDSNLQLPG